VRQELRGAATTATVAGVVQWEYEFLEAQLGNLRSKWVLINEGIRFEGTIQDLLNSKGAEGWEVVATMHPTPSHWEFLLKRPVG